MVRIKYRKMCMHCYLFQEWSGNNNMILREISEEEFEEALNAHY